MKSAKHRQFGGFLKKHKFGELGVKSVTRQVKFINTNTSENSQNSNETFLGNFQTMCSSVFT